METTDIQQLTTLSLDTFVSLFMDNYQILIIVFIIGFALKILTYLMGITKVDQLPEYEQTENQG